MDKLTREQIYAMTPQELRLAVAKFMGWNVQYYIDNPEEVREELFIIMPDYPNDIAAAMLVLDMVAEKYMCDVELKRHQHPARRGKPVHYSVVVSGGNLEYDTPNCSFYVSHEDRCIAICQAALMAVQS